MSKPLERQDILDEIENLNDQIIGLRSRICLAEKVLKALDILDEFRKSIGGGD